MALELPFGILVLSDKPVDTRMYNVGETFYATSAEVIAQVPIGVRYQGQSFIVDDGLGGITEYWFKTGIADIDLIEKTSSGGGGTGFLPLTGGTLIGHLEGTTVEFTGLATLNSFVDSFTKLGTVGDTSLDSITNTPSKWSNLPVGYSRMMSNLLTTAQGAPVNGDHGYFTKIANRDSLGGWSGIWISRSTRDLYVGVSENNTVFATWTLLTGNIVYDIPTDTYKLKATQDGQVQNLGQENFFIALNEDTSANTLNPRVFKATGVVTGDEGFKTVSKVVADQVRPGNLIGLNTTEALNNGKTKILTHGDLNDVNTSAWVVNTVLYIDPVIPGELTAIKPTANAYFVAVVTKSDAINGKMYVQSLSITREDIGLVPTGLSRLWFTSDTETTFLLTKRDDKGADAGTQFQQIAVDDNVTTSLGMDWVGPVTPAPDVVSSRIYEGNIEFDVDISQANERFYIEVYLADSLGAVIDSGSGLAPGTLGSPPMMIMTSALLNTGANIKSFANMTGFVPIDIPVLATQRIRFKILCEKVGSAGGLKTFTVFHGFQALTYVDAASLIQAEDVKYNNVDSSLVANNVKLALDELDTNIASKITSKTNYVRGDDVLANTFVEENSYTGISLVDTSEGMAPQETGPELDLIDTDPLNYAENSFIGVVEMRTLVTVTKNGFVKLLEIMVPEVTPGYHVEVVIVNITESTGNVISVPALTQGEFNTIALDNIYIFAGTQYEIRFRIYNSSDTSLITGGWNGDIDGSIPSNNGEAITDDRDVPTIIRINYTDLDNLSRITELNGVPIGAIITCFETGDNLRSTKSEVTSITIGGANPYVTYTLINISTGSKDGPRDGRVWTINIESPITQPTKYNHLVNYWPSNQLDWATVTSELYLDGALQANVVDGYAANFKFVEASISADWKIMTSPDGGGGGGISLVQPSNLGVAFTGIEALLGLGGINDVDWLNIQVYVFDMSSSVTLTFSNLYLGVLDLEVSGNFALTLPVGFDTISGSYVNGVTNYIQIVCVNPVTAKGYVSISQVQ